MTDERLHQVISQTRPEIAFPSSFQREIWTQIGAAEIAAERWWGRLLTWLARPIPAVSLVLIVGGLGCLAAALAGADGSQRPAQEGYLRSVSPFAAAEVSQES